MVKLNKLTKEQIKILRANPYVLSVSDTKVRYTAEFKELFWKMYTVEHLLPREILSRLGVDPNILGKARVRSIAQNLRTELERSDGATGFNTTHRKSSSKSKEVAISDIEVSRLRSEVAYLRQEREFLKKIISAGKGQNKK